MMTPILTRNSLKMECGPLLCGNALVTPTKRLRNAYERPPHCVETPPQFEETLTKHPNTEEEELTFSEFLVRIGNIIFQMHCILDENISDIISLDIISDIIS